MARGSHICAAALALTAAAAAAVTSCAAQAVPVWWPPHPVSLLQLQAGAAAVPATYAYYGGNYLPSAPWHPNNRGTAGSHNNDPYWQRSPYWQYFRQVWGDAPFTDANFRLWMGGFFQGFDRPRKAMPGQVTQALPAWLHYYGPHYDPIRDPPYSSDFALFSPDGAKTPPGASDDGSVRTDCSTEGKARPCGVGEQEAMTWSRTRMARNDPNGLAKGWVRLGKYWSQTSGDSLPSNMPPPPQDPPTPPKLQLGDGSDSASA